MFLMGVLLQVLEGAEAGGIIEKLIDSIVQQGPLAALFLLVCIYLGWRLNKKEKEIKQLNDYIRANDKENLETLNKLSTTLDKIIDTQKNSDSNVVKEIKNTKEIVVLKIDNLSNKVDGVDNKLQRVDDKVDNLKK
jgi:hypothetical protein